MFDFVVGLLPPSVPGGSFQFGPAAGDGWWGREGDGEGVFWAQVSQREHKWLEVCRICADDQNDWVPEVRGVLTHTLVLEVVLTLLLCNSPQE